MNISLAALVVSGVALGALAVGTARPPHAPVPDRDGHLLRWQAAHGGHDPRTSVVLRHWLVAVYAVAGPVARRGVQPAILTLVGLWLAGAALLAAAGGGRWAIAAACFVIISGLSDALDGAVAVLSDRATAFGAVLDSGIDRIDDGLYLLAVWFVGVPAWLLVATGAAGWSLEYLRARAAALGAGPVGTVTVGERPSRVLCCAAALLSAALTPFGGVALASLWMWVLAALSAVGLAQLLIVVHRRLGKRAS